MEALEITCTTVKGSGTLTNEEKGTMQATGSMTIEHSGCVAAKPGKGVSKVEGPIIYKANFATYQSETEMGLR